MKSNKEENGREPSRCWKSKTGRCSPMFCHGLSAGFAFAPDGNSFCYVHEPWIRIGVLSRRVSPRSGRQFGQDEEIFCAGDSEKSG